MSQTLEDFATLYDLDFTDMLDFTLPQGISLHDIVMAENALHHRGATLAEVYQIENAAY